LREHFIFDVALLRKIFGEKDTNHFMETWVPLMYAIVKEGAIFNWDSQLSHTMMKTISRVRYHNHGTPLEFYMSSYLLDII
jgi:hypothetical protein